MTVPTLPEVRAGKAAAPEYRAAWKLQQDIEATEKELESMKVRLADMLSNLTGIGDGVFRVVGLKTRRSVNPAWFEKNMPDVYRRCMSLTETAIGRIMTGVYSRDEILEYCQTTNPQGFRDHVSIKLGDLSKLGKLTKRQIEDLPTGLDGAITINTIATQARLEPVFIEPPKALEEPEDED